MQLEDCAERGLQRGQALVPLHRVVQRPQVAREGEHGGVGATRQVQHPHDRLHVHEGEQAGQHGHEQGEVVAVEELRSLRHARLVVLFRRLACTIRKKLLTESKRSIESRKLL